MDTTSPAAPTGDLWHEVSGIDPATATFPARVRVADEGIVVFRQSSGFVGVQRACPHQGGSMLDAVLQGNDTLIRCTKHNYVFRTATGGPVNCPGFRLQMYDVKEEGGRLFARARPLAAGVGFA